MTLLSAPTSEGSSHPFRVAAIQAFFRERAHRRAAPAVLCIAAVCVLASPYLGISGDARIYIGRAMADLDPDGLGRDMMFARDGQSGFSIFRIFAAASVRWFGPGNAAMGFAIVNTATWFTAVAVLAGSLVKGRARGLLVACAAVLPSDYASYPVWAARETLATPRPLSEAFVLLALAAVCEGRTLLPLAVLGAAAAIHPIMALPGFAVVFILLGLRDRRWWAAVALMLAAVVLAAFAGAPFLSRLSTTLDGAWRAVLEDRNSNLFIAGWPTASLAPLTVQAATVAMAAGLCEGRCRALFVAVLVVGFGGVAASWLLGDRLSLLLILQAQTWRALWLVSVIAMPAFGLCLLRLPDRGPFGRIALAFLGLAWLTFDVPIAPLAALLALLLGSRPPSSSLERPLVLALYAGIALAAAVSVGCEIPAALAYLAGVPENPDFMLPLWKLGVLPPLILGLALAWTRVPAWRHERLAAIGLLGLLAAAIVATWDHRSAALRRIEAHPRDATLATLVASRAGEVLWLGNDDEWLWLGRPQWASMTQGAAAVFSRPLALQWHERTAFLVALGVFNEDRLRPWQASPKADVPSLTSPAVAALCARPDAPAWIIVPLPAGRDLPPGVGGVRWRAPVRETTVGVVDSELVWSSFDTHALVPCAGSATP